jgi:hypothetical protein
VAELSGPSEGFDIRRWNACSLGAMSITCGEPPQIVPSSLGFSFFRVVVPQLLACVSKLYLGSRGDMIVGRAVGLHHIVLLLPGDDDVVGVLAGVDDSAEVACGAVVEVARLVLVLS